jgi:hypothetical protein
LKPSDITYLEKVEYILNSIQNGIKRDKISLELGYSNPKSLDIFMRRKGFLFDKNLGNYSPIKISDAKATKTFSEDKRLNNILSLFSEDTVDAKKVAQLTGFHNHIELADYMKSNNYIWNEACSNYIRIRNTEANSPQEAEKNIIETNELHEYLPLLRQLYKDKERLLKLITSTAENSTLPEYSLTGLPSFLSITINENLNKLLKQFSEEKAYKLDKVFEVAIVEFLIKYNYNEEIQEFAVLNK